MTLGLLSGCGYTGSYMSSMPCSIFCSGLTQLVFFLLRLLFQQRRMLCHVRFCFLFSSVVCRVLHRSLRQHNSAISTTPEASLWEQDGSMSTTPQTYVEKHACETPENYMSIFRFFTTQISLFNKDECIFSIWPHVCKQTDIHVSCNESPLVWGSLRLAPITKNEKRGVLEVTIDRTTID